MRIVACAKWVDLRPDVDPMTGEVAHHPRTRGASDADQAALEVALAAADAWGGTVTVVTAGPAGAEQMLRDLGAAGDGVGSVRVDLDPDAPSDVVAAALAHVTADADLVVCGAHSTDRGSGSVPALVAHHRRARQALGLTEVSFEAEAGTVTAVRRLGAGRAERVRLTAPAVISVEGAVARLRRASLDSARDATRRPVRVEAPRHRPPATAVVHTGPTRPLRPRTRVVPAPAADAALGRIVELTGALVDRTPPRTVELDPLAAAEAILEQLRAWGYLE